MGAYDDGCESMALKKKAMYFTVMTIAMLTIFTFIFLAPGYQKESADMLSVESRIDSINSFIESLNRDVERGLYISSYMAILSMEGYIISEGSFLNDTEDDFMEAVINGTLHGKNLSLMKDESVTFPDWIKNIRQESSKFNIDLDLEVKNMTIYQKSPWHVTVGANYSLQVNESTGLASWNMDRYAETDISIIGFEDPLYIRFGLGRTTNIINRTIFDNNYARKVNGSWNLTNLMEHIRSSYYSANQDAPSFLSRLEYDLDPSPYGIESFVDIEEFIKQGISTNDGSSIIDFHYFADDGNAEYRINFTPSWVKIDDGHRARYNVSIPSYGIG